MAYSNDWTVTDNPADHSKFKNVPAAVRKVRTDVQERLDALLYGFISGETEEAFKKLYAKVQASDPTVAAGYSALYCKTVSGKAEWFLGTEDAVVTQITSLGKLLVSALTIASGALGDLFYHDGTNIVRLAGNTTTSKKFLYQTGNGSVSAAPAWGATPKKFLVWHIPSDISTGTQKSARFYMPFAGTISKARAYLKTAPTGADVLIDLNKNGSTIWSTQANRLTVSAAANTGSQTSFNTTTFVADDYIDIDIDQVGSTEPGEDLTVQLEFEVTG